MTPEQSKQLAALYEIVEWSMTYAYTSAVAKAEWLAIKQRHGLTSPPPAPSPPPNYVAPKPNPERWFVCAANPDHRKGTHLCWRIGTPNGDRFWWNGKDDDRSSLDLARCLAEVATGRMIELDPATGEAVGKDKPATFYTGNAKGIGPGVRMADGLQPAASTGGETWGQWAARQITELHEQIESKDKEIRLLADELAALKSKPRPKPARTAKKKGAKRGR
jgi:hypothetical protein